MVKEAFNAREWNGCLFWGIAGTRAQRRQRQGGIWQMWGNRHKTKQVMTRESRRATRNSRRATRDSRRATQAMAESQASQNMHIGTEVYFMRACVRGRSTTENSSGEFSNASKSAMHRRETRELRRRRKRQERLTSCVVSYQRSNTRNYWTGEQEAPLNLGHNIHI